ncbi:hypothetical protein D1BOALGB6SA_7531 [Olavius sp. associated proteobacterium Delta 1]|nr:hypothetical protein D1BOALGB6SA_7531 [Olavius sp. associated proteobacterium Delta 1]
MKRKHCHISLTGFVVIMVATIVSTGVFAAEVDVYAEGAFTTDQAQNVLDIFIYADLNFTEGGVLSYGVTLTYSTAELEFVSADKNIIFPVSGSTPPYTSNPGLWEFGDDPAYKDNPAPENTAESGTGRFVVIGGKLNQADPTAGVTGARVFLAKVTFRSPSGNTIPPNPALALTYAVGDGTDSYRNFVGYNASAQPGEEGVVLDSPDSTGVNFHDINVVTTPFDIAEYGDANADGNVNSVDYATIRDVIMGSSNPSPSVDCNRDGKVNVVDYVCVRNKIL